MVGSDNNCQLANWWLWLIVNEHLSKHWLLWQYIFLQTYGPNVSTTW